MMKSRPPIVGVPCFTRCPAGPSSRLCCPSSFSRRNLMNFGPATIASSIPRMAARMTLANLGPDEGEGLGDRFEADGARTFHEHAVSGADELVEERQRLVDGRRPHPVRLREVVLRQRPDREDGDP